MQATPSLPADPGLRLMVVMACIGILALIIGTVGAAIKKDTAALKAVGGPLLALSIILSFGRQIAPAHPFLMASIVLWCAHSARRCHGLTRWSAAMGGLGLATAYVTGLLLF